MAKTKKIYLPGDKWIYYKLYSGPKMLEFILANHLASLIEELMINGVIQKWFFIRYRDPHTHIRLRINFKTEQDCVLIIKELNLKLQEYTEKDIIWKINIDSYRPELNRYGSETMSLTEELFFFNSKLVVNFLGIIEGDLGEELRWLFAIKIIDSTLESVGFDLKMKSNLLNMLDDGYSREFKMDRNLKKQLDTKYRLKRKKISDFLKSYDLDNKHYPKLKQLLDNNQKKAQNIHKKVVKIIQQNSEKVNLSQYLASLIHMQTNRIFLAENRLHELVTYNFLSRHYNSEIAQRKKKREAKRISD